MRAISLWAVLCLSLAAQSPRPLTIADYDSWKAITGQTLSEDGKWLAYALMPQTGDGEVIARDLATAREIRIPIGKPPVPQPAEGENEDAPPPARGPRIVLSPDGHFLITQTFLPKSKTGIAIANLASGAVARIDNVKSFALPETGAPVLAYLEDSPERRLALRLLDGAASTTWEGVTEYALSRDGVTLAAATADELFVVNTATTARTTLHTAKTRYAKLTFNQDSTRLAFLAAGAVYGWERGATTATEWAKAPTGQTVNDRAPFAFTRNGAALLFTFSPRRRETPAAAKPDPEKPLYELWHWKDETIQTIQKARANSQRNRGVPAIFHIADKKLVPLGDANIAQVTVSDDATTALGFSDQGYGRLADFDTRYRDIYTIDTRTGARQLALKQALASPAISPDGTLAAYFEKKAWWLLDMKTATITNLTAKLPTAFSNELYDLPGYGASYGTAGWTKDSKTLIVYDRYDIWTLPANGAAPTNITQSVGRKQQIRFRITRPRVDPRDPALDPAQPLLLSAENETTKDSGFYRHSLTATTQPEKLVMAPKRYSAPVLAKKADVAIITTSRFDEFPDLQITDSKLSKFQKVTDANPQKKNYAWGTAELVNFKNTDGAALSGILYKPANFDPAKKYPLLVYIYERLSDGLHGFVEPSPSHRVNASLYASNGYLVLMPDIAYTAGYPGDSAMKCVLAAVQKVADMGIVDEKKIGIQGHSWGGYQIAYMVTRTNRFAAAAPGALVANMTSAYDGIRYGTGVPRQFQYERGQSRIGGSLWEYPMRYLDNSPLFRADQIQTPLLMLHNDKDDAVPFTQGLEFYLALRRLNKEVYFFNYNGEPHGLRKRPNQKDYAQRMFEFFGHFLQGAPAPEWMEKGIPYTGTNR